MKTNWKYKEHLAQVAGLDGGNCDVLVAKVYGKDAEEIHEHGTLIAAAPEMYEELKNILNADYRHWDKGLDNPDAFISWAMSRIRFLLAKVEAR